MNILPVLIIIAVLGPLAALTTVAHRSGKLRWRADQFRMSAPMVGPLFPDDADLRRVEHDVDAIRTRFEQHPSWPSSGALGERR